MSLIDTHTHLEPFMRKGELDAVLARAREAGLEAMIAVGTSPEDWSLYRDLAKKYPGFIYYSVGLHPCYVDERWSEAVAQVESFWSESSAILPVALGEVGLDRFHLPKKDTAAADRIFRWQRSAFAAQLEIFKHLRCPMIIHARDAFKECVEMIDASGVDWRRVVFHCFGEDVAQVEELKRRGAYASFTGIITYPKAENVRAAAKAQGLERLMVETDAPYLTPDPHRGKQNEPSFVKHTAEYAAKMFGVPFEEVARVSTANAKAFFGLGR